MTNKHNLCKLAVARSLVDAVIKDLHMESGDVGDPFEWAWIEHVELWQASDDINTVLNNWGFYEE